MLRYQKPSERRKLACGKLCLKVRRGKVTDPEPLQFLHNSVNGNRKRRGAGNLLSEHFSFSVPLFATFFSRGPK